MLLSGVLAGPAVAQEVGPPPRGKHLGLGAGLTIQESGSGPLDATWWLTTNLRFPLGQSCWLESEIGYWQREPDPDNSLSKTVNLGANFLVTTQGRSLRAWAGVGLGLHLLVYQVKVGSRPAPGGARALDRAGERARREPT